VIPARIGTEAVIPAKAGIPLLGEGSGIPACAGLTK
jgi:hypothetical protein